MNNTLVHILLTCISILIVVGAWIMVFWGGIVLLRKPMNHILKHVLWICMPALIIVGACYLLFGGGRVLQVKVLGTYLPVELTVESIYVVEHFLDCPYAGSKGCSYSDGVFLEGGYLVNEQSYTEIYELEDFASVDGPPVEAQRFLDEYSVDSGDLITVYYDPKNPEESVLRAEEEMHTWLNYLVLFPAVILGIFFACGIFMGIGCLRSHGKEGFSCKV